MKNALTQDVRNVVLSFYEGLDCARSLSAAIMLRYDELDQLTTLETDPRLYLNARSYFPAAAATDLLRKFPDFTLGIDLEEAAKAKWWECERACWKTNHRLYPLIEGGPLGGPYKPAVAAYFERVRKKVYDIVGPGPSASVEGRFGPGATVSDPSRWCTLPDKMSSTPTLTNSAFAWLVPWTGTKWATACAAEERVPEFTQGNVFFTVPKTARTLRACAKEPSINGFYQLGLGKQLRKKLKSVSIDLDHGQDVHRQVACAASNSGDLATLDLSSASDTIATALVQLCLPRGWFAALDDLRSKSTKVDGKWVRLEKFSSMGNGFTFELETLLFLGLILGIDESLIPGVNVFVYGDDIIVPTEFAQSVEAVFRFCGLSLNKQKSFKDSEFRESCGGDFFGGKPVRAHFQKENPNEPQKLISLANGIGRVVNNLANLGLDTRGVRRSWFKCLDLLPGHIRRLRGPQALGDIVIHDDETRWQIRTRSSIRYVRVYRPAKFRRVKLARYSADVQFAVALYQISVDSSAAHLQSEAAFKRYESLVSSGLYSPNDHTFVPRDGVRGYKIGWVPYS